MSDLFFDPFHDPDAEEDAFAVRTWGDVALRVLGFVGLCVGAAAVVVYVALGAAGWFRP